MAGESRVPPGRAALAVAVLLATAPDPASADSPISAIDWLSRELAAPITGAPPRVDGPAAGPVSDGVVDPPVTVRTLDAPGDLGAGLFPAARVGLPADFWGATGAGELAVRLRGVRGDGLPAAQRALQHILLAEFDPPVATDSASAEALMLARIDKLIAFGTLDQAKALVTSGARITPAVWQRWFDLSLLLGEEDRACARLREDGGFLAPLPARAFCLARGGDWAAAMLSVQTAQTLDAIDPVDAALLLRFLDAEDAEAEEPPGPPPASMTPLRWRLLEAVGDPVSTGALPLAYAHADLRGTAGWRAQIEAAERLTRSGALEPNRLLGLYTDARAAASGGVWDRVRASHALDAALARDDPQAVGAALQQLWPLLRDAALEVPFARLIAERLDGVALSGTARDLGFEVALLGGNAPLAEALKPDTARARFLLALATGAPLPTPPSDADGRAEAIAGGLADDATPPPLIAQRLADGHGGDSALVALDRLADAKRGDLRALSEALPVLRAVGMEPVARRAALELMLLGWAH